MHPMNWDRYYRSGKAPEMPSAFAQAVEPLLKCYSSILDVGCGNGRDSVYFRQMGHEPIGVDQSREAVELARTAIPGVIFQPMSAIEALSVFRDWDVIYMRWLLHAVPRRRADTILKLASCSLTPGGVLAIEARSANGEQPDDHARWPVPRQQLREKLERLGLTVEMMSESTDFSPVGDDRPLLLRCLARLKVEDRRLVADGAATVEGGSASVPARPPQSEGELGWPS